MKAPPWIRVTTLRRSEQRNAGYGEITKARVAHGYILAYQTDFEEMQAAWMYQKDQVKETIC
ncbi:MAG: hypothetical protein ACLTAF_02510 [Blautia coccoides]